MGVLEWESQCGAAMGWGRLQPQQALPGVEGAPQRLEALTPAFQAVGFLQEGPGNQPQAGHWLVRLGTQASGIVSFLLRCPRDPDKGSAFRKSSPLPTTAEETAYYQLGPEKARGAHLGEPSRSFSCGKSEHHSLTIKYKLMQKSEYHH